jgi:hypothetical protein
MVESERAGLAHALEGGWRQGEPCNLETIDDRGGCMPQLAL